MKCTCISSACSWISFDKYMYLCNLPSLPHQGIEHLYYPRISSCPFLVNPLKQPVILFLSLWISFANSGAASNGVTQYVPVSSFFYSV